MLQIKLLIEAKRAEHGHYDSRIPRLNLWREKKRREEKMCARVEESKRDRYPPRITRTTIANNTINRIKSIFQSFALHFGAKDQDERERD